jgi:hypothetical protein
MKHIFIPLGRLILMLLYYVCIIVTFFIVLLFALWDFDFFDVKRLIRGLRKKPFWIDEITQEENYVYKTLFSYIFNVKTQIGG